MDGLDAGKKLLASYLKSFERIFARRTEDDMLMIAHVLRGIVDSGAVEQEVNDLPLHAKNEIILLALCKATEMAAERQFKRLERERAERN